MSKPLIGDDIAVEVSAFAAEVRSRVRVVGTSMLPFLRPGMIVEIDSQAKKAGVGDVLVFRGRRGLVVHRVTALRGNLGVQTCGDAIPEDPEHVSLGDVVGRVRAVWANDSLAARHVHAPIHPVVGAVFARTRSLRATIRLFAQMVRLVGSLKQGGAFSALAGASIAFEHGDFDLALRRLLTVPIGTFLAVAKQHAMGGHIYRWLAAAADAGIEVPSEYVSEFRNLRWFAALSSAQVVARTHEVSSIFTRAGIEAIFLKGAARLCSGAADANINPVSDVDVLVPSGDATRAVAALHAAEYAERMGAAEIRFHERHEHHRAPLWPKVGFAPVEVHVSLCTPGSVSVALEYENLVMHVRTIGGSSEGIRVLDDVGSALHLAYHGRDLHVFRDILLLSRLLRNMSVDERSKFDRLVAREARDATRLRSAIAAADGLFEDKPLDPSVERYLSWVTVREDLPRALRKRSPLLEAWLGRVLPPFRGASYTIGQVHRWMYNLLATPVIISFARAHRRRYGPGSALFGRSKSVGK